jgi:hypothetical protein
VIGSLLIEDPASPGHSQRDLGGARLKTLLVSLAQRGIAWLLQFPRLATALRAQAPKQYTDQYDVIDVYTHGVILHSSKDYLKTM